MAFAMAMVLLLFAPLCFASIRLVKRFPVGVPILAALLYAVGLWQIRATWHVVFLFAMPFLAIVWVFYHPLIEGFLLGIQMRRERNPHPENPTAVS